MKRLIQILVVSFSLTLLAAYVIRAERNRVQTGPGPAPSAPPGTNGIQAVPMSQVSPAVASSSKVKAPLLTAPMVAPSSKSAPVVTLVEPKLPSDLPAARTPAVFPGSKSSRVFFPGSKSAPVFPLTPPAAPKAETPPPAPTSRATNGPAQVPAAKLSKQGKAGR